MSKLNEVKRKIRTSKRWGFLAEMLGETELAQPTAGVNHCGILLVNPELALQVSTNDLVRRVRQEFRIARELRDGVNLFR
jgi:hypothetical protein